MILNFEHDSEEKVEKLKKEKIEEDNNLMPITYLGKLRSLTAVNKVVGLDTQKISIKQISNDVCRALGLDESYYTKKTLGVF